MAESDLHLKLDRILAILHAQQQAAHEHDQSIKALKAVMLTFSDTLETQSELLTQLAQAMSQEQDSTELRDLIQKIEAHMARMVENSEHTLETLNALPQAMSEATADGVRLAMSNNGTNGNQENDHANC